MADITSISDITTKSVTDAEDTLVNLLQSTYPNINFNKGSVIRDLLIRPAAILSAMNAENLNRLRRSMSLAEVDTDPTLADTDTVDNILSNFQLTRLAGTKSTGRITIAVDSNIATVIISDTKFTSSSGDVFVTESAFTGVTSAGAVLDSTDRLMRLRSDGKYTFTIEVTAETAGAVAVSKDARFTLNPQPTRFFDAFAEGDFTAGQDVETNAQLVARLKTGLTAKVASGRSHIEALIKDAFPTVLDVSVVGLSDEEMVRDKHNIFGLSRGGMADIYVRTALLPTRVTLTKDATLVDATLRTWRLNFSNTEVPGFYRIESIILASEVGAQTGSLTVSADTRALNLVPASSANFVPAITDISEGVYSSFQTADVVFTDPQTSTTGLTPGVSTTSYAVTVSYMPSIDSIQTLLSGRSNRAPQSDYLVRAPIPCFVGVEIRIDKHPLDIAIDTAAIAAAVASSVNALTFEQGKLSASELVDIVHALLPSRSKVSLPIHLWGSLRQPDGASVFMSSTQELIAATNAALSISTRTVAFYLRVEDVDISVVTSSVKGV